MNRKVESGRRKIDVLGTAEVAGVLGVAKESVSRMIREGRLVPDVRLDCGPIFRRSTIERFKEKTGR